ncbi:hypothetical protein M405DRAFT_823877 [Rhizopogon salebrosus TDB-379]|nr:hypothetical protein M405DRAFT_823877 [Rhizopogon salebrosus TDB-379]
MPGRRRRRRVQHVSTPITLDDSMVTPRQMRRPHHSYSSDSTDSQTPLTDTVEFYYPPQKYADPSGRPILGAPQQSERRTWRWWRFFGLGPHKVTSQVPSHRFQIEGPDESSVGHGDGDESLGSPIVAVGSGWTSGLPALCEQDEGDPQRGFYDRVIQIGDPQVTIHSTPRTPAHYEDVAVAAPPGSVPSSAKTPAPEYRSTAEFPYTTSNLRNTTTVPTTVIPQISYHTTGPTHSDSPEPPVYSSVSRSEHPSVESIIHPARSDPTMLYPGSVRAAGRSLPRMYQAHERQASTESVLASSTPMVTQGLY